MRAPLGKLTCKAVASNTTSTHQMHTTPPSHLRLKDWDTSLYHLACCHVAWDQTPASHHRISVVFFYIWRCLPTTFEHPLPIEFQQFFIISQQAEDGLHKNLANPPPVGLVPTPPPPLCTHKMPFSGVQSGNQLNRANKSGWTGEPGALTGGGSWTYTGSCARTGSTQGKAC